MTPTDEALDAWVAEELERSPVTATVLGAPGHDDRLGDLSAAGFEQRARDDRRWAARLDALVEHTDDPAAQIDLVAVLSTLAGRAAMQDWAPWRRDPDVYLEPVLYGVYELFVHRLRPDAELVAAAVARMRQVPEVVAAARANLDPALVPPLFVERGRASARAGATYLRDLLAPSVDDPGLQADLASAGAAAAEALDDLTAHLDGLAPRARGDWAIGEERYSALLRQRELLPYGATELHARGLVAWDALDEEMTALAAEVSPGGGGWHAVVASLAADHPADPDAMLEAYRGECERARAFLVKRGLVTLPEGERCLVVPSPTFQRPLLAVASYSAPAAWTSSRVGRFYVPYPPEGASASDVDERLADNGHHAIPTTSVHEAYPGHHWQLSHASSCARPVRKVVSSPYFIEGWALYAEKMMREQGYFADARAELCSLDARIFRAARIVVDTALHTGQMTREEAVTHMSTKASLPPAVAAAEVDRYCAWPTQAPSYLTGALEIERMCQRWLSEGRGDLRAFHDLVASSPGLPLPLAERVVFGP